MAAAGDWKSTLSGKRILLTGGNGFIGRRVLQLGQTLGIEWHALVRKPGLHGKAIVHSTDLLDFVTVRELVGKIRPDAILHLAAAGVGYGSGTLPELIQVNAAGFANLLEAAGRLDPKPAVVAAGSGFEYSMQNRLLREDDPVCPQNNYGISKVAAAAIAASFASRFPITLLRLFSVYGPGESPARLTPYVVSQIRQGQPVELTPGEQIRDYAYVDDLVEAFFRALANPPVISEGLRVLNVGSGELCTLRQFIESLAAALEKEGCKADLRFGAKPYRAGELMYYAPDIERLRKTLDWTPPTLLKEGVIRLMGESL